MKDTDWKARYYDLASTFADRDGIFEALHKMKADLEAAQAESRAGKDVGVKERDSMLAIIAAMAIRKYRYNPNALKNAAMKNIADDIRNLGLDLDVDTVRKYVSLAGQFLKDNADPDH